MKEYDVDSMKYRKSSHLAGVDVDAMVAEKGKLILTIKQAYYSKTEIVNGKKQGENVNGKIVDAYVIHFVEDVKPMIANSKNRKSINKIVQTVKNCTTAESRILTNWTGIQIELFFDPTVKFGDEVTGGIVVKAEPVVREKKPVSPERFQVALTAIKNGTYTKELLIEASLLTPEQLAQL